MPPSKGDPVAYFRFAIQPAWIVVDIGANTGGLTGVAAERVGADGHVVAIEPDARCWPALDALAHQWPWVTVHRGAVGATWDPSRRLFRTTDSAQSSIWREALPQHTSYQDVPVQRLDTLLGGPPPDLVKIDAQGSELAILEGSGRLSDWCPRWLLEVWPAGLTAAGASVAELVGVLASAGLTPRWLHAPDVDASAEVTDWISTVRKPKSYVNLLFAR